MKVAYEYSHNGGVQLLRDEFPTVEGEIRRVVAAVRVEPVTRDPLDVPGAVAIRRMNADELEMEFRGLLQARGFGQMHEEYSICLPGLLTTPGYTRVGLAKGSVFVGLRFVDQAALFYDAARFQRFSDAGLARAGALIAPTHAFHREVPGCHAFGEQLIDDLSRLGFPSLPLAVLLVEKD